MDEFMEMMAAALEPEPEIETADQDNTQPEGDANDAETPEESEPSAEGAQDEAPADDTPPAQPQPTEAELQQRAMYANMRRANEAARRAEQQLQELQQRQDAMARARGFASFAELEQAVNAEAEQRRNEALNASGINPEAMRQLINQLVGEHPSVKAADAMRQRAEEADRAARIERGRKAFDDAIVEIGKIDPTIKSAEDLQAMPNRAVFDELVRKRGYGLVDAFKLANFDALQSRKMQQVKQETMNSVNGRSHLKNSAGAAGESAPVVPADELAWYKALNPDATEAEIRKHWEKSHK